MTNHSKAAAAATPERKGKRIARQRVVNPDKELADRLRAASARAELKKRCTVGIYTLKVDSLDDSRYGIPFVAANDNQALLANKQILPTANCYRIGTFCLLDGTVSSNRPAIILDKGV